MHVCWLNKAFCLPLIIFHIIQPYPSSMGNYFIKIINKKLQMILRGKSKVTQPPCFGSFALKRSILGKLLLRPVSFLQCRSWFWMERFRKPWTPQSQPEAQVLLHICFSLNGWRTWREAWKGLWSHGERLGRASKVHKPICCWRWGQKVHSSSSQGSVRRLLCLETLSSSAWNHPVNLQGFILAIEKETISGSAHGLH